MSQCQYQCVGGSEGAWEHQCETCGHVWTAHESDPARLHRLCEKSQTEPLTTPRPGPAVSPRERAEGQLREMSAKAGDDARPWPAILATLDRCFGDCKKMDERAGHCTLRGKGCTCRTRWIEYLVFHPCDYVPI